MKVYLVWDTSGSMHELGKRFIARSVARTLEQYFRLGYASLELKLVAWSDQAQFIDWSPEQDFPAKQLTAAGMANANSLIALLGPTPEGKIIFLTDGYWSPASAKELRRWKDRLPSDTVRVIKVGADANPLLKGEDVFAAESIFAALDGWLQGGES